MADIKLWENRTFRLTVDPDLFKPLIQLPTILDQTGERWGSLTLSTRLNPNLRIGGELGGGLSGSTPSGICGGLRLGF